MKASKFVILAGGILGILAFFLPMVTVQKDGAKASLSAFQIVKGVDAIKIELEKEQREVRASMASIDDPYAAEAKKGLDQMKGIVMAFFAPAFWLVVIGGIGLARKQFGRVAGTFSLLLGLAGLGIGALLKAAAEGDAGIALTLLLFTGLAGVVGGIMALAKPERRAVPTPA
jgi:hypothetical protein